MSRPLVRFLSHGAERSGPPIYLLRLLRYWKMHPAEFDTELVIARPGALATQFAELAPTSVARLDPGSIEMTLSSLTRVAHAQALSPHILGLATRARVRGNPWRSAHRQPEITIVNGATVATVALLRQLQSSSTVLTIAHELSTGWFGNLTQKDREFLLEKTTRFLAVSQAVKQFLLAELGVSEHQITVIHPAIDVGEFADPGYTRLAQDFLHVGGSGMTDWRKAPEIWLRIAAELRDMMPQENLRFTWLGGENPNSAAFWPLEHEMNQLSIAEQVRFTGQIDSPAAAMSQFDLFISTAREDAYPLACAEAVSLGVPVIGFESGGLSEMARESGCALVVPYPEHSQITRTAAEWLRNPALRNQLGKRGTEFGRKHLDVSVIAPAVGDWILGRAA
ncbi:MAG: glycosyltransferase family 4 protein [Microthrixaceae bacterium]